MFAHIFISVTYGKECCHCCSHPLSHLGSLILYKDKCVRICNRRSLSSSTRHSLQSEPLKCIHVRAHVHTNGSTAGNVCELEAKGHSNIPAYAHIHMCICTNVHAYNSSIHFVEQKRHHHALRLGCVMACVRMYVRMCVRTLVLWVHRQGLGTCIRACTRLSISLCAVQVHEPGFFLAQYIKAPMSAENNSPEKTPDSTADTSLVSSAITVTCMTCMACMAFMSCQACMACMHW